MKNVRLAALVFALVFATVSHPLLADTAGSANELAGLWKAKKRFGPDARGTHVLQRIDGIYTADMVGRIVPVSATQGAITFTERSGHRPSVCEPVRPVERRKPRLQETVSGCSYAARTTMALRCAGTGRQVP